MLCGSKLAQISTTPSNWRWAATSDWRDAREVLHGGRLNFGCSVCLSNSEVSRAEICWTQCWPSHMLGMLCAFLPTLGDIARLLVPQNDRIPSGILTTVMIDDTIAPASFLRVLSIPLMAGSREKESAPAGCGWPIGAPQHSLNP